MMASLIRAVVISCVATIAPAQFVHSAGALRVMGPHTSRAALPVMSQLNFETLMNSFMGMIRDGKSLPVSYSVAEVNEYCRDDDSSGCDIDMLDALKARGAGKSGTKAPKYHWSPEIDAAVFKAD
jgi:hypothetical protein